jgi:hypothetical protein
MENSIIEKLDRARYNLLKWFTFGWAVWFGTFILRDFVQSSFIIGIMIVSGLCGWILWIINMIKIFKLGKLGEVG